MDKFKLVERLREKTGISYEEAKEVLEKNNWDILDAIVYLERTGRIKKPSVSEFYTNEHKESYTSNKEKNDGYKESESKKSKGSNKFEGIFEAVCEVIDTCNNIFIKMKKRDRVLLKLPLTVVILLLLFGFWIIVPLVIVGLFFDIEFLVTSKKVNTDKAERVFRAVYEAVQDIKRKLKKEV